MGCLSPIRVTTKEENRVNLAYKSLQSSMGDPVFPEQVYGVAYGGGGGAFHEGVPGAGGGVGY